MEHFEKWMKKRNELDALITSKKSMLTASEVEAAKEGYQEALEWCLEKAKDMDQEIQFIIEDGLFEE